MTPAPRYPRALILVGVVLFAFTLRMEVAALSPLFDFVEDDFGVPTLTRGLIASAPPVCYAVFGMLTPYLERRIGLERLAVGVALVIAAGVLARSLINGPGGLLATTVLIFAGVGVGNVIQPPLARKYFPDRIGAVTSLYSVTMALSTLLPPLVDPALTEATNWRVSLGLWAIFAVSAAVPWALLVRPKPATPPGEVSIPQPHASARMWRIPLAWAILGTFSVSSVIAYVGFGWLPTILGDSAGLAPAQSGAMMSLFVAAGIPWAVLAPLIAGRTRRTGVLYAVGFGAGLTGVAGLIFAPALAPALWVTLLGTTALFFPLALLLVGMRTRTAQAGVALSSFVQAIGYGLVAFFPFGIGVLHELTGSWTPSLLVLAGVVAMAIPSGIVVARKGTVEDAWERRYGAW